MAGAGGGVAEVQAMRRADESKAAFARSTTSAEWGSEGMTLREYAAVHALQGLLSRDAAGSTALKAQIAVEAADALLKALGA